MNQQQRDTEDTEKHESTEKRKEKELIEATREKVDSMAITDTLPASSSVYSAFFSVTSVPFSVSSVSRFLPFVSR